nr:glycosyltransferase [Propionicimonas sp.]
MTAEAQPLVSVVVPVWNVAHLLPRCLDSLLAQTHRPLEIIVVDDGSTDGSRELMLDYAERHREVHVVTQPHRGLGAARNAALSIAGGEYVAMVDADDWVEPDFIAHPLAIARTTGADVVVSRFWFQVGQMRASFPLRQRTGSLTGPEAARLSLHLTRLPAFAWSKLYRRDLFRDDDPPFPSILYEDLATAPRVLLRADSVALTRRPIYHYCLRRDSITGQLGAKNVFSFAAALDILRHDLHAAGYADAWRGDFRTLLRQAMAMLSIQVLFQPNRIPLRVRGPLLARYAGLLRALAEPPEAGHGLRVVPCRRVRQHNAEHSPP